MATPASSSPRSSDGPRRAILEAATDAISQGGEASVRITEIARTAGVTQGMISYYFKDREGLITEAQIARYSTVIDTDQEVIRRAAMDASTPDDFRNRMSKLVKHLMSVDRHSNRKLRTSVLGSAMNRPLLMKRIVDEQSGAIDRLGDALRIAQQRGLIRTDINPRSVAEFVTAYIVGMVIVDPDPHQTSTKDKVATFDLFLASLMP